MRKAIIYVYIAFLTALAFYAGGITIKSNGFLSIEVTSDGKAKVIDCYNNTKQQYFFFLPSYTDLSQTRFRVNDRSEYALDGCNISDGDTCEAILLNQPYELEIDGEIIGELIFTTSANVRTMFIETASGNVDKIHESKEYKEAGKISVYDENGSCVHAGNILSLKSRGNSTWSHKKKSYSMELSGASDILGVGAAKKWVLLANPMDTSNLRNKIAYDFAKDAGMQFSPDCDWVDLYLNGEYAGLYLLSEKIEIHPYRVNIAPKGSVLVSRDSQYQFEKQDIRFVVTQEDTALRIYSSGMDDETIKNKIQSVENAIMRESGVDPITGKSWEELLDVNSWVNKYLIDEVFGNVDATAYSQFYYFDGSDPSGKMYAGPVWDFDLSMGHDGRGSQELIKRFYANMPDFPGAYWPDKLYKKEQYYDTLVEQYINSIRPLLQFYISEKIPFYAETICEASKMNCMRWNLPLVDYYEDIVKFLTLRIDFLDSVWVDNVDYCYILVLDENWERAYYAVESGSFPPSFLKRESSDKNFEYRWYNTETNEVFMLDEPLTADVSIHLQYERVLEMVENDVVSQKDSYEKSAENEWFQDREYPSFLRLLPMVIFCGIFILLVLKEIHTETHNNHMLLPDKHTGSIDEYTNCSGDEYNRL